MAGWYKYYRILRDWGRYLRGDTGRVRHVYPYLSHRGDSPLELGRPWLVLEAIEFLESSLGADATVFEWGSGGSTLFFAEHAGRVISVEHDEDWYSDVRAAISESGLENVDYALRPPSSSAPDDTSGFADYEDNKPEYEGEYFESYVREIESFDDGSLDCVVVDGVARPSCIVTAMPKVAPGGMLVVDNSERVAYQSAIDRLVEWDRDTYHGPALTSLLFTETSVFTKPTPTE